MKLDILGPVLGRKRVDFDDFSSFFTFCIKFLHHFFHFCQNWSEIDSKLTNVHIKNPFDLTTCALMYTLFAHFCTFWRFFDFHFCKFYQKPIFSSFLRFLRFFVFWCLIWLSMSSFPAHLLKNTLKNSVFRPFWAHFDSGAGKTFSVDPVNSVAKFWSGSFKTRFWPFFIILTFWRPFSQLWKLSEVFYTGISLFIDHMNPIKITSDFVTFVT